MARTADDPQTKKTVDTVNVLKATNYYAVATHGDYIQNNQNDVVDKRT